MLAYAKTDIEKIETTILVIRGQQVILDRDLAVLYNVSTKRLNEQVKRNSERFPDSFKFQLTEQEKNEVVAKCDHLVSLKFSTILPYAFTEQGVAMISTVLKSEIAVNVSIRIMTTFVEMRRQRDQFSLFDARISSLEKMNRLSLFISRRSIL